jgi:hypothetical protein
MAGKAKAALWPRLTVGNGLVPAFLVTAFNISEVSERLKVAGRVWVPRPQRRPEQLPASLGTDQGYDSAHFGSELRRRRIQPSIPWRERPNRRSRPGRPQEVHEVSEFRWKVERSHGGWTTGIGWSLSMTGTPNPTSPSDYRWLCGRSVKDFGIAEY